MLTNERVDALINECATFGREVPKDGSIQWMKRAEIYKLCAAVATESEAAATAEARATIQQLVDALGWLHLGEGPETRVGPALEAGRAWLGEAQKGDGHDPQ